MICVHCIEHRKHVCWVPWRTAVHWWCRSYCKTDVQILSVFTKEDKLVKGVTETLAGQILKFQYLHTGKYDVRRVGTVAVIVWKCVIFHLESSAPGKAYFCSCQVTFKKAWKILNFLTWSISFWICMMLWRTCLSISKARSLHCQCSGICWKCCEK